MSTKIHATAWLVVAVITALIVAPSAAQAAATVVRLVGLTGSTADVTKAHQLTVAEAAPANFRQYRVNNEQNTFSTGKCFVVTTLPAAEALVIKQLRVSWTSISSPGLAITYYVGADCSGPVIDTITGEGFATSVGGMQTSFNEAIPVDPGFGVPAGTAISARVIQGAEAGDYFIDGYAVPPSDVVTATGPD